MRYRHSTLLLITALSAGLWGCTAPASYAGVDLRPGQSPQNLQTLASRAQAGDKQAQLELGIRYEEGRGVGSDLARAVALYRAAAQDDSRPSYVYSSAVGNAPAALVPLAAGGTTGSGLQEARERLARLESSGGLAAPATVVAAPVEPLASKLPDGGTVREEGASTVVVQDCPSCPPMVQVPSRSPSDPVLFFARHELTWREYVAAVRESGCPLPPKVKFAGGRDLSLVEDDFPIGGVPPNEIGCYLDWINKKTGKRYRLPTGAEWTYAARAGVITRFPWGDALERDRAAIWQHFTPRVASVKPGDPRDSYYMEGLAPVESFAPNRWGLYDVVGNLTEYVAERRLGPETCLRLKSAAYCQRQATRGGGKGVYAMRVGDGPATPVISQNPMDEDKYWFAGYDNPVGYRLVRN